jgi:hypothetical protein
VKKELSSANALAARNSWDIQGTCKIKCPGVEGGWSLQGDPVLTLDMHQEMGHGNQQFYDMFNFSVVEGIMRFEKPISVPQSGSA